MRRTSREGLSSKLIRMARTWWSKCLTHRWHVEQWWTWMRAREREHAAEMRPRGCGSHWSRHKQQRTQYDRSPSWRFVIPASGFHEGSVGPAGVKPGRVAASDSLSATSVGTGMHVCCERWTTPGSPHMR